MSPRVRPEFLDKSRMNGALECVILLLWSHTILTFIKLVGSCVVYIRRQELAVLHKRCKFLNPICNTVLNRVKEIASMEACSSRRGLVSYS